MVCCFSVVCFFCLLGMLIGLLSLIQLCLGVYLTFIQTDLMTINRLIRTDKFDSYLAYILLVFIGLGLISLLLTLMSICGMVKKNRALSLFVAVLWVFSVAINLIMLVVLLLYYFIILPQLRPLLLHTLQRSPSTTITLLDPIQSRYNCCGINDKNDYKDLSINDYSSSCWNEHLANQTVNSTTETSPSKGCYPIIDAYVNIELWTLVAIAALCAFFQFLAIILMCILNQRYKNLDENPKFTINHIVSGVPLNVDSEHRNATSAKAMEEPVEITQI